MKAILSDIHGNLEALDAVLADIDRQGVTEAIPEITTFHGDRLRDGW